MGVDLQFGSSAFPFLFDEDGFSPHGTVSVQTTETMQEYKDHSG